MYVIYSNCLYFCRFLCIFNQIPLSKKMRLYKDFSRGAQYMHLYNIDMLFKLCCKE